MKNTFTVEDIKPGYLGVLANGDFAIAMEMENKNFLEFVQTEYIKSGEGATINVHDSFNQNSQSGRYDLVAVYGKPSNFEWFITENRPLLWKREEKPIEMTILEIEGKLGIKNLKIVKENK